MRIAILGATGLTGKQLVQQALAAAHDVVAVVRTPEKMSDIQHQKLTLAEASIFNAEELKQHFEGVDAVISTIGFPPFPRTCTGYSEATKNVVKAMRETSCKRLILMHTWNTPKDMRNDYENDPWFIRWVFLPMIRPLLDNMRETEEFLEAECSDLDYTVVSPPGLTNNPMTDLEFVVRDDLCKVPGCSIQITRADVARYMLKILSDESSFSKIHAIATSQSSYVDWKPSSIKMLFGQ